MLFKAFFSVVITVLKLENLKAIHNTTNTNKDINFVVITVLKLENLKAIHNIKFKAYE